MSTATSFLAPHETINQGFEMATADNFEARSEKWRLQIVSLPLLRVRRTCVMFVAAIASVGMAAPIYATATVTQFTYDAGNNVTSVTDPRGLVTSYAYDGLGQIWGQSSPDTGVTTFNYDAYGRRTSMTRSDNSQTTYAYDSIGRLSSISAGTQTQSFVYDTCTNGEGRICSASDGTGSTSYSYSPEGRITGRGFSVGGTVYSLGYGYDSAGELVSIVYPDGNEAIYSYTRGVVSGVSLRSGGATISAASGITYQPADAAMSGWTSSNGLVNTLTYDSDGRLIGVSAGNVESLALSYDAGDRVIGMTNGLDGNLSQNYGYDDQSRLVSVYSGADEELFQYDANGNRISQIVNGVSQTYTISAVSNQLSSVNGSATVSYGYDSLGNLIKVNGSPTYQFDSFNRLAVAGSASDYVDVEGARLRKISGAGTTYFAITNGALQSENRNGAWTDYIWLNGRLIGRVNGAVVDAVHEDQIGRPQVVTDSSGTIVWQAANYAFDRVVTIDNIGGLNLGFPGQYYDSDRGSWNNGFRDYVSQFGRYLESDPEGLGAGINTYAYAGGSPIFHYDMFGLSVDPCGVAAWLQKALDKKRHSDAESYLMTARDRGLDKGDSNLVAAERYMEGYNGDYNSFAFSGIVALKIVREIPFASRILGKNGSPVSDAIKTSAYGELGIYEAEAGNAAGTTPFKMARKCACGSK